MDDEQKKCMVIPPSEIDRALDFIVKAVRDSKLQHLLRDPEPETGRVFVLEAVQEVCKRDAQGNYLLDPDTHKSVIIKAHEKLFYCAMEMLSKKNLVDVGLTSDGDWCFRLNAQGKKLIQRSNNGNR